MIEYKVDGERKVQEFKCPVGSLVDKMCQQGECCVIEAEVLGALADDEERGEAEEGLCCYFCDKRNEVQGCCSTIDQCDHFKNVMKIMPDRVELKEVGRDG